MKCFVRPTVPDEGNAPLGGRGIRGSEDNMDTQTLPLQHGRVNRCRARSALSGTSGPFRCGDCGRWLATRFGRLLPCCCWQRLPERRLANTIKLRVIRLALEMLTSSERGAA